MPDKFQNKYRIPSARAYWHNYNGGIYFITINTVNRIHYFGEIIDNEMVLSPIGKYLDEQILDIKSHYVYAEITHHQVMPNHVHLIIFINSNTKPASACRDVACHVSDDNKNREINDLACHVSDDNKNREINDLACHVSDDNKNREINDLACHDSDDNKLTKPKNEKMQLIALNKGKLSVTIGGLKSAVTRFANNNNIEFKWQARFHDHIIRDQEEFNRIAFYIENNVALWEYDINNDRNSDKNKLIKLKKILDINLNRQ